MSSTAITDQELSSLTQAILRRYGMDFTCYEISSFKRRVSRSISVLQLESIHELWIKLLKDPTFIYRFIDEISVGLTSMFRDPVLWEVLRNETLKELRNKEEINIWHAGCSTGEEVYTMAIVLQESGLLQKSKAIATDISETAIETARRGRYHELKIHDYSLNYEKYNPLGLFRRYHRLVHTDNVMNPELSQHVTFQNHNLITDLPPRQFDIIFCRNVMIYFDQKAKLRLLKQFHDYLYPGGYLIIGFYDALVPLIDKSKFLYRNQQAKIFQKI